MAAKKKSRKNLTVRLSEQERGLLIKIQSLFGLENDAQTVRKIIRDTALELGVK